MTENRYEVAATSLLVVAGVTVRKWRKSMTGVSYTGTREISAPRPLGPISFAIVAHEIYHALAHQNRRAKPRWIEEVEAEEFALRALEKFGLPGHERVAAHIARHLRYSFKKALRRGVSPDLIAETFPVWWRATGWKSIYDEGGRA